MAQAFMFCLQIVVKRSHLNLHPYSVAFTRKLNIVHPAIGLRVTVVGKHQYSGYHGVIRDVLDLGGNRISVELEARFAKEIIEKKFLTLRQ